jgi:hypothetical protein
MTIFLQDQKYIKDSFIPLIRRIEVGNFRLMVFMVVVAIEMLRTRAQSTARGLIMPWYDSKAHVQSICPSTATSLK